MTLKLKEELSAGIADSVAAVLSLENHIDSLVKVVRMFRSSLESGGKIMTAGNGGSAAEALHMSEELVGRFRSNRPSLPGICLCADCTALTCIGNDFGYDQIFSRQVDGLAKADDILVLFSTSGNSRNLELALQAGRKAGCRVVSLLGRDGGRMRGLSDEEIIVRGDATERIQEAHQVIVHLILNALEDVRRPESV